MIDPTLIRNIRKVICDYAKLETQLECSRAELRKIKEGSAEGFGSNGFVVRRFGSQGDRESVSNI